MTLWADTLRLVSQPGFLIAIALSSACIIMWTLTNGWMDRWLGAAAAAVASIAFLIGHAPVSLTVIAAGLWIAGELAHCTTSRTLAVLLLTGPALALGFATGVPQRWPYRLALAVFVLVGWYALRSQDRQHPPLTGALFAISTFGLFATVPDTSFPLFLLAVTPVTVVPAMRRPIPLGPGAAATLVGLFSWAAVTGGVARPASIVGALTGLGVIWIVPILGHLDRLILAGTPLNPVVQRLTLAAHAVTVAICSRIAGLQARVMPALIISLLGLLAGALLLFRFDDLTADSAG